MMEFRLHSQNAQLEICAETVQACSAAFEGGADRIEICSALNEGGVTPSHGLIQAAIAAARELTVHVLLRPRAGNFVYSDREFIAMCADLEHAATLGAAGFAVGILRSDGSPSVARMRELVRLAGDREVTFHRAFDLVSDVREALETVIDIGCGRVLTSGGKPTVGQGMGTIVELAQQANGRIRIAAGGGVSPEIAKELRRVANVDLHVSLRPKNGRPENRYRSVAAQDPLWEQQNEPAEISVDDVRVFAAIIG
jgi:copper homeostasis protein